MKQLEEFFAPRIFDIERGEFSSVTAEEIIAEAKAERGIL